MLKQFRLRLILTLVIVVSLGSAGFKAAAQDGCPTDGSIVCTGGGTDPEPVHPQAISHPVTGSVAYYVLFMLLLGMA